ncbi:MAG: hypothetical protein LBE76_02395 [Nitrososphaerota archaeon]|jgi:hypothetical protein|nr:hypothetical protein [Nitrososphaerota archaeon]
MFKNKRYKLLIVASGVLSVVICGVLFVPMLCFPLETSVSGYVFHVGDKISGTATITNKSGIDVHAVHSVGSPCIHINNINNVSSYIHHLLHPIEEIMKTGDKLSLDFTYECTESGLYIVETHAECKINNYPLWHRNYTIVIVLK